ncbi:hypothetical protein BC835DRAFT_1301955 [Cytidiella melzeri]|nr:hypothetical protein BC835DRAFT_1301955 [Cytidiella melzeri]
MDKTSKYAQVVVSQGTKHLPELTSGLLTPKILALFAQSCRHYFRVKKIADDEQASIAAAGCQDADVSDWWLNNEVRFKAMTFDIVINKMRKRWLKRNWADEIRLQLEQGIMTDDNNFDNWVEKVGRLNGLLKDMDYHLSDSDLHRHLKFRTCYKLCLAACSTEALVHTSFQNLKEFLSLKDEARRDNLAQIRSTARQIIASNANLKVVYKTDATSPTNNFTTGAARAGSFIKLPPLMQVERDYLKANNGCFKCRCPFVNHYTKDCPNDYPDPKTHQPLATSSSFNTRAGNTVLTGTTPNNASSSNKVGNKGCVAAVEEVVNDNGDETQTIAAI